MGPVLSGVASVAFTFIPSILPKCVVVFSNRLNIRRNAERVMERQVHLWHFVLHTLFLLLLGADDRGNCGAVELRFPWHLQVMFHPVPCSVWQVFSPPAPPDFFVRNTI